MADARRAILTRDATWKDLPQPVRAAVEQHTGPVADTTDLTNGQNSDIATVLRDRHGQPVFLKGVSRRMRWLRNEITAGQLAAGVAQAVRFTLRWMAGTWTR